MIILNKSESHLICIKFDLSLRLSANLIKNVIFLLNRIIKKVNKYTINK